MTKKTYMFIGAHPDDADIEFGGTAIKLLALGHRVVFTSLTDGSAGHQTAGRGELRERRHKETQAVAQFLGLEYIVMDTVDTGLVANVASRHKLIKLVREIKPDVIITAGLNEYHPDHYATGQLVQDAAFLLRVPAVLPEVPRLEKQPYILYHQSNFKRPYAFVPDILVDITDVIDRKMESLAHHESQVFEWLPFIRPITEPVPLSLPERIEFCKRHWGNTGDVLRFLPLFNNPEVKYAEAFMRSEYGAKVTAKTAKELFPFALINFED